MSTTQTGKTRLTETRDLTRRLRYSIHTELAYYPIPKIPEAEQQPFINRVEKILTLKKTDEETRDLENEIDALVFHLYQLTEQEMLNILIENKTSEADRRDIQAYFRRLQREKNHD